MDVDALPIMAIVLLIVALTVLRLTRRRAERRAAAQRALARHARRRRVPDVSANVRGLATEATDLWAEEVGASPGKGRAA